MNVLVGIASKFGETGLGVTICRNGRIDVSRGSSAYGLCQRVISVLFTENGLRFLTDRTPLTRICFLIVIQGVQDYSIAANPVQFELLVFIRVHQYRHAWMKMNNNQGNGFEREYLQMMVHEIMEFGKAVGKVEMLNDIIEIATKQDSIESLVTLLSSMLETERRRMQQLEDRK